MKERVAKLYYEDYDENGLIKKGIVIEGEDSGTIMKVEKEIKE